MKRKETTVVVIGHGLSFVHSLLNSERTFPRSMCRTASAPLGFADPPRARPHGFRSGAAPHYRTRACVGGYASCPAIRSAGCLLGCTSVADVGRHGGPRVTSGHSFAAAAAAS